MWQKAKHRHKLHQCIRNESSLHLTFAFIQFSFPVTAPGDLHTQTTTLWLFPSYSLCSGVLFLSPCSQHARSGTLSLLEKGHNLNNRSKITFPTPSGNSSHNLSLKLAHSYSPCYLALNQVNISSQSHPKTTFPFPAIFPAHFPALCPPYLLQLGGLQGLMTAAAVQNSPA